MKIAIKIHCQIIQKTNQTDIYTKEDVKAFIREYIKVVNKMTPEEEK